jgi:hypothetical protein
MKINLTCRVPGHIPHMKMDASCVSQSFALIPTLRFLNPDPLATLRHTIFNVSLAQNMLLHETYYLLFTN